MITRRKILVAVAAVVVVFLGVIVIFQFVGPQRSNPPVTYTVNWDSAETEATMRAACYDCHSNETVWPWYAYVPPVSWLVIHDVNEGRENLNFSTGSGELESRELIEVIEEGEMPLEIYTTMHANARLDAAAREQLIAGIRASDLRD